MRFRAAQQLFLTYLLLIAGVVLALSFGADSILRRLLMQSAVADLRRELSLGRVLYESLPNAAPDSVASLLGELSGRRVTIVAPDGTVIGDSRVPAADLPAVANHADRPEVRDALAGRPGFDLRASGTLRTQHLYVAERSIAGAVVRFAVPTAELDAAIARVQRIIYSVGAAALALAALFSLGFSFLMTRPLRTIAGIARQMSSGSLSQRIPAYRSDELGALAHALNSLAEELQRRLGQIELERAEMQTLIDSMTEAVLAFDARGVLRRANPAARRIFKLPSEARGLRAEAVDRRPEFLNLVNQALQDTSVPPTELSHLGRSLLASAHPLPQGGAVAVFLDVSELRRLEGVRRDFVANASHELKTPLTAIRGYTETLLDPDLPPELRRQFTETVRSNAERLQHIVDDLLDLSRLESGGWRPDPEPILLEELAREVWSAASVPTEKAIRFDVEIDPEAVRVLADPAGVRQILANLFSNAVRYTPAEGRILLRARRLDAERPTRPSLAPAAGSSEAGHGSHGRDSRRRVLIEVIDTGIGIATPHLPRIFERFYRVDPARSRAGGGTGLGLAIVRHLVEAHRGQVEAASELGHGTTIRFTLSAAPDD